jgi:cytidine deaminase
MEDFIISKSIEALDTGWRQLIQKASDATHHAYAPYSNFCVGAAVLMADGTIVTGTNQENAAYPSGMCAERVALFCVAASNTDTTILKIAVVARQKSSAQLIPVTCCGSCRQVILEFESQQEKPISILMMGTNGEWINATSAEALLPFSFGKKNLLGEL